MGIGSTRAIAGLALAHLVRRPETSPNALDGLLPSLADQVRSAASTARESGPALAALVARTRPHRTERVRSLPPRARTLAASTWSEQQRSSVSGFLDNLPAARPGYSPPVGLAQALVRRRTPTERLEAERVEVEAVRRLLRELSPWDA